MAIVVEVPYNSPQLVTVIPGSRLGVYAIVAKIGQGGMGEVFRAHDSKLDRDVAIKVLPEAFAADVDRLARFQREAKTLASLNHPNIASIYGLEENAGVAALIMELVEGEDLSQRIAHGSLPLHEAIPIALQIVSALEAAHEHGIIHRDLKPANVKVRHDGTVKVLDFGLAKAMLPAFAPDGASASMSPTITSPAMTQAGMILGTAAYMSPEQAKARTLDKRSDIWAFGAVLYEMLTGRRAFAGDDVTEVIASVMKDTPDWSALPLDVPPAVVTLIQRCLEKDRAARIGDIAVARFVLTEAGRLGPPSHASAGKAARQSRVMRIAPWVLAALLLISTVAVSTVHLREAAPHQKSVHFQIDNPDSVEAVLQFRLSPDGSRIAFVAAGSGRPTALWVRSLDSLNAALIPGTDQAEYPFWSPDGTEIAFFAEGKLKKIAVTGGLPVTLCDAVNGRGGAWNQDGVILFAPDSLGGLYRVADTGGAPVRVTTVAAQDSDRFPEFLPDGQKFVFLRTSQKDPGIYGGTLAGGAGTRIVPEISNAAYASGFLLFRRDNTLMAQRFDLDRMQTKEEAIPIAEHVSIAGHRGYGAFAASRDGDLVYRTGSPRPDRQLVWLDRSGKRLGVATKPGQIFDPALSPDGRTVAFSNGNVTIGASDIWLQHLDSGVLSRFTFGPDASARAG